MALFGFLRRPPSNGSRSHSVLMREWSEEGVRIRFEKALALATVDEMLATVDDSTARDAVLAAYLSQLVIEERCSLSCDHVLLPWRTLYELLASAEHQGVIQALEIPAVGVLRPILECTETLADVGFDVFIDAWTDGGSEMPSHAVVGGAFVGEPAELLLSQQAWEVSSAIREFSRRAASARSQHDNELAWGEIRAAADACGALYRTPYLETTYVLTPKTLRMPLVREVTRFGSVVTVSPTFDGAPDGWLRAFDGFQSVQGHYDLAPKDGGLVRVVLSDPVKRVLEVIKRDMPGRRVAGSKAERFIHNPWAMLGESASEVLKEEEFAEDKANAGALAAVFSVVPRIHESRIDRVDLVVTEHFHGGTSSTSSEKFLEPSALAVFVQRLESALLEERSRFPWGEQDLSIDGESSRHLEYARQVLHLWNSQPQSQISFDDIYELEGYSDRIEGIGVAKAIYVPLLQKPADDESKPGWLPGDLTPMVRVTLAGHEGHVVIPLSRNWVDEFEGQVRAAEETKVQEVRNAALPTPLPVTHARTLVDSFRSMLGAKDKIKSDGLGAAKKEVTKRETLLVKLNFHEVDYVEERKSMLSLPSEATAMLPSSLRASIALKEHQRFGIAWFQHLVSHSPTSCRGALLADDMGLGKTLQLLAVLGRYYEDRPDAPPALILAPKSLVYNWEAETTKFFTESFAKVLVLYADELRRLKQPLGLIDEALHARGVVDLLKPNWIGDSKIVITTYEVLTHYEFSLAKQPFTFVICDEAQRIKTPGTQASIAARALNADFRIACTGTPVENSLADLWCLFDFVQPGLLGGLEEFARSYRRPIECNTEEHTAALARLKDLIAPQTLRRTKQDIKNELPKKYFAHTASDQVLAFKEVLDDEDRLTVPMSNHQNLLYLGGLKKLQDASAEKDGRKRARMSFGALHLMKAVCAEPYCLPGMKFLPDEAGSDSHLVNSPKLAWLLDQLGRIRDAGEKAIIFTELREVQAALFYFLRESFGIKPSIINGDSQNRQSYIDKFSSVSGFNVIILSTLAAGAGLNVTAANHVFHFTRAWNPSKENQATDRAYRIGQERDVHVYCPVIVESGYDTFDVLLDKLLRRKAGLANAAMDLQSLDAMLNGSERDVSFAELMGGSGKGKALESRFLTMDDVDRMNGFRFEVLCMRLWSAQGYIAQLTNKRGGDGGIDIIAIKGREGELLQCKSSGGHDVGWDAIKEVTAGAAIYQAQFAATRFRKIAVTNQRFTSGAREQAEANHVQIVERARLEELLALHPVSNFQFDDEVSAAVPFLDAA